jgi:DNA-binding NarL/FixJ family response regulator
MSTLRTLTLDSVPVPHRLAISPATPAGMSIAPPLRAARRVPAGGQEVLSLQQWTAIGLALRLSPRELQIVQSVFDDLKEAAIADKLGISSHTVHTHLERLYRKLSVRGRTMMAVRVFAEYLRMSSGALADEA